MMSTTPPTRWKPAFTVRYDGSRIDEVQVNDTGDNAIILVRDPGATRGGGRWHRKQYDAQFGATRREAIEKFHRKAQRDIELAVEELQAAQALLARALQLAADEPQEQVQ